MHNGPLVTPLNVQSASIAQLEQAVLGKHPLVGITCFGTHYRPDIDELAGIALIQMKELGSKFFPNLAGKNYLNLRVITQNEVRDLGEDAWYKLLKQGCLAIGIARGPFDDHNQETQTSATQMVAEFLGVQKKTWLRNLLSYVNHEDNSGQKSIPDGYSGPTGPMIKATWRVLKEDDKIKEMEERAETLIRMIKVHLIDQMRFEKAKKKLAHKIRLVPITETGEQESREGAKIAIVESDSERAVAVTRHLHNKSHDLVLIMQTSSSGNFNIHEAKEGSVSSEEMDQVARALRLHFVNFLNKGREPNKRIRLSEEELVMSGEQEDTHEIFYYPDGKMIFNGALTQRDVPGLVGNTDSYPFTVNSLVRLVTSVLRRSVATETKNEEKPEATSRKEVSERGQQKRRVVTIEIFGPSNQVTKVKFTSP
jgi:hypothetical protein